METEIQTIIGRFMITRFNVNGSSFYYYALLLIIGTFPALSLIIDGYGSGVWYLLGVLGIAAFASKPTIVKSIIQDRRLLLLLSLPLAFVIWSFLIYHFIDPSDFAKSRFQRHTLLLICIPVTLLFYHLNFRTKDLLLCFSLSGIVFLVYWLLDDGAGRLDGLVHAIHFGNIALIIFILCCGASALQTRRHWFIISVVGGAGSLLAFIQAGSRGGVMALVLALLVIGFWFSISRNRIRHFTITLVLVMLAAGLSINFIPPLSDRYDATIQEVSKINNGQMYNSVGMRFMMWDASLEVAAHSPFIGSGFSAYRTEIFDRIEKDELKPIMSEFSSEPHNQFLYQLASHGLIGVFLFLLLVTVPLFYLASEKTVSDRASKILALTLSIIFLSFLFFGLTITLFDQRRVLQSFGLLYSLTAWFLSVKQKERIL
ncbi:O-antigen ligase family protein [Marinobacter adhaerens]|uniref:O-antigen ligase family protein n=1 Tax=Marinobacter adhaerens TaxID=1033846 RepID=A0A851HZN2_9GAMM|nr:O-antigen ligase family protein [Marinobacter adhaerens]NWN92712.1 O-antigen ligase family protein [Marinobacter adhaerens]